MSILHITAELSPLGGGRIHFYLADHALAMIRQCNWDAEDMYLSFQVEDKTAKLITGSIKSLKGEDKLILPGKDSI